MIYDLTKVDHELLSFQMKSLTDIFHGSKACIRIDWSLSFLFLWRNLIQTLEVCYWCLLLTNLLQQSSRSIISMSANKICRQHELFCQLMILTRLILEFSAWLYFLMHCRGAWNDILAMRIVKWTSLSHLYWFKMVGNLEYNCFAVMRKFHDHKFSSSWNM